MKSRAPSRALSTYSITSGFNENGTRSVSMAFSRTLENNSFFQKMDSVLRHHDGQHHRQDFHWLVDSFWFNGACAALVTVNAIILGFETDYPEHTMVWMVFENVFTGLFLLEMITKLVFLRQAYFYDIANWLDATIVAFSVVDCWLSVLIAPKSEGKLKNFQILRVLRMVRVIRVIRILRYFRRLVLVVRGVIKAMETTFWVACVLLVSVYCCAIFVTEFVGRGTEELYPAYSTDDDVIDEQEIMQNFNPHLCFGGMMKSMFTLFNIAIMSEWLEVVRPIAIKQPQMMCFFIVFALFVTFGIMNVIVAMIVDNVLEEKESLEEEERNKEKQQKHNQWKQLLELIRDLEEDDHTISIAKLKECMEPEVLFTHKFDDPQSFEEKIAAVQLQREVKHPEEKWDEEEWQKRLDIRDAFGDKVDMLVNDGNLLNLGLSSLKKGLTSGRDVRNVRDAIGNLKKSQFPLTVKIQGAEAHSLLDLLARCNLPEGLSAEELIMMFDSSGDGVLQHHEFLTNFYRLIEHTEFQQIALLQGGINSIKCLLRKNGSSIKDIRKEIQELRKPTMEEILEELHELRKLCVSDNSANNQRYDPSGLTSLASLIQETHRITEQRLQSFEEKMLKALDDSRLCWQNRLEVDQIAVKPAMMEPTKQIQHNDVINLVSDCNSLHKDVDDTCGATSFHGASCTESIECNGNVFSTRLHDVFQEVEFEMPHDTSHKPSESEKECESKACRALDDTSRGENYSGADQLHCRKLLSPENQYFQYEVVVQDSCSLGCTVTWGYPEIADVGVEAAKRDIWPGDVIVECAGASTCGKSREELLKVFQSTRPLHLVLRRCEACSPKDEFF